MGLAEVTSRRMWFVPDFTVWGLPNMGELAFVTLEQVGAEKTVLYGSCSVGESSQEVSFDDLVDFRGNVLPEIIESPRVFLRSHTSDAVFVVGSESGTSFKVAREADSSGPVAADLLIIEMGG
ncbi:MAG: hypothetical protein KOO62_08535 [candidate division Zixibacteria bacterium]|nr:hypothetical protein [candidate division Zixibacteria bacterium]